MSFRKATPLLSPLCLQILLLATARAFCVKGTWILFSKDPLKAYALFTKECMNRCEADPKKLRAAAFSLGSFLRKITFLKDPKKKQQLILFLYRQIGITMEGTLPGTVHVPACYFSSFYTPRECATMSFMDEGIMAGISGDGTLTFTEKLTEGCSHCTACFTSLSEKEPQ